MPRRGQRRPRRLVGDAGDPRGLGVLQERYLEWLRVRQYRETTVVEAGNCIDLFARWCEERSILRASEVTRPVLERYQRYLYCYRQPNGRPLTARTQRGRVSPLRGFFGWLARERMILYNPTSELEMPRVPKTLPKAVLSRSEVEAVLRQPDVSSPFGMRDRAILETLYSTGIRRMELANLDVWDVDASRGWVWIREGKGGKDRVTPIGDRALRWVEKYEQEVRPRLVVNANESALFLTREGNRFLRHTLSHLARRYVDSAEIGKRGSCHIFRHTAATLMLEGGADIRYIQQFLGHENLKTTEIYTRVSIDKLKAIHSATHPGAQLVRSSTVDGEDRTDLEDGDQVDDGEQDGEDHTDVDEDAREI